MTEFKIGDRVNYKNGEFLGTVIAIDTDLRQPDYKVEFAVVEPGDDEWDWYGEDELRLAP